MEGAAAPEAVGGQAGCRRRRARRHPARGLDLGALSQLACSRQADVAEILAERGEVNAAPHRLRATPRLLHRLGDLGLSLEHVIAVEVLELLAREPDQTKPV